MNNLSIHSKRVFLARSVAGVLLTCATLAFGASGAQAAPTATPKQTDSICEQARSLSKVAGPCEVAQSIVSSAAVGVSLADIPASDLSLLSNNGVTLQAAAAAGTIYTKTWSQEQHGLYYVNWKEKHTGRIYYDGSQVWSTTSYRGYKGNHTCDQGYGVLYDIKVTSCSTERLGTSQLNEWDYYQVHVVWSGIPLYASHNMHVHFTNTGVLS